MTLISEKYMIRLSNKLIIISIMIFNEIQYKKFFFSQLIMINCAYSKHQNRKFYRKLMIIKNIMTLIIFTFNFIILFSYHSFNILSLNMYQHVLFARVTSSQLISFMTVFSLFLLQIVSLWLSHLTLQSSYPAPRQVLTGS